MDVQVTILSQYRASFLMMERALSLCPPALWEDPAPKNRYWQLAYHALFYTHLYLHTHEDEFTPWSGHQRESQFMGPLPWPPHELPAPCRPYGVGEVREFLDLCRAEAERRIPLLDLDAPSGFSWLPFDKLELQFYNLRHLQHHLGQLADRLRISADLSLGWVGKGQS